MTRTPFGLPEASRHSLYVWSEAGTDKRRPDYVSAVYLQNLGPAHAQLTSIQLCPDTKDLSRSISVFKGKSLLAPGASIEILGVDAMRQYRAVHEDVDAMNAWLDGAAGLGALVVSIMTADGVVYLQIQTDRLRYLGETLANLEEAHAQQFINHESMWLRASTSFALGRVWFSDEVQVTPPA